MKLHPEPSETGIIGCLDAEGACLPVISQWADRRSAKLLCEDGAFRLWDCAATRNHSKILHSPVLTGLLSGSLYENPSARDNTEPSAIDEAVTQSYGREGHAFLLRLIGQFSAFLWDRNRQELMLYRDDSGTHSAYFTQLPSGAVVFSDRLSLLVTSPLVGKRLSRRSIHEFLRFLDVSAPNTIYEGVFATEPGVLLRVGKHGLRHERTRQHSDTPPLKSLDVATDELERKLSAAVAARTSTGGTTVVFLSGGVDSSLICAMATARKDTRVEALTVGFSESEFDESGVARRVAEHLGVPHHVLSFPMSTYREAFDKLTAGICYPSADPAGVPTLLAFQTAREYADAALDGTGADTLFGVMPARHQRFAVQFGTLLPRPLRRLSARALKAVPTLRGYAPLVDFDDPEEILIRWRGWQRCELESLCGEPVSLAHTRFYRLFSQFPRNAHLQRYSALLGNLPDDRIHQASALTGLEVRFPYFDPRVTEWVNGLDLDLRYHPSEPKRVLKAVLARHIPRPLWDSPKHGFDFPFQNLMVADDCALIRQYLDPSLTGSWGLFDQKQLNAAVDSFIRGDRRSAFAEESPTFRVWSLVVLFAWLENHYRHL